jgi:hypothetical protein
VAGTGQRLMYQHTARKPAGHIVITSDGPLVERDTRQCVHCAAHFVVEPGSGTVRGWCRRCAGPTCGAAKCNTCLPFEAWLDEVERRASRDHRLGLG